MARFNFTNITSQSKVDISDIMGNFTKIENSAALSSELTSAVNTLNTTINTKETALKAVATTSANGMMSSTDKAKLDGIASGANNYTLPTASSTLGGVKTTSAVSDSTGYTAVPIINGVPYYKDTNTTYGTATTGTNGLMSAEDKRKLNGISNYANNYSLPTAGTNSLGGVKTTSTINDSTGYIASPIINGVVYYKDTNTTYSAATTSSNGLMTSSMVTKLNGISSGATANTVENNLTSTSTTNCLSAYQGKVLKDLVNTKQNWITISSEVPSGGNNGDIYIQYFN